MPKVPDNLALLYIDVLPQVHLSQLLFQLIPSHHVPHCQISRSRSRKLDPPSADWLIHTDVLPNHHFTHCLTLRERRICTVRRNECGKRDPIRVRGQEQKDVDSNNFLWIVALGVSGKVCRVDSST
jgi:hypothetical protein